MSDQQRSERRHNDSLLQILLDRTQRIEDRVFDGLGKELREEVKHEIDKLRGLLITVLISLLICFAGIIIESRVSANYRDSEIREIKNSLDMHRDSSNEIPN